MSHYKRKKPLVYDKKTNEILHTRNRIKERYGIELTIEEILGLGKMIRSNKSRFIRQLTNRTTLHEVIYAGQSIGVVYDRMRKVPTTAYPLKKEYEHDDND